MIKVIRELVAQPQVLVMCDASCGVYIGAPLAPGEEDPQLMQIAGSLVQKGWRISLTQQLCPQHAKGVAAVEKKLIIVPSMVGMN